MTLVIRFHNKPCWQPGGTRGASKPVYPPILPGPRLRLAPETVRDTDDDGVGS
jgi:hypothetical protein